MFKINLEPNSLIPFILARASYDDRYLSGEIELGQEAAPMKVWPLVIESMVNEVQEIKNKHPFQCYTDDLATDFLLQPNNEEFLEEHIEHPMLSEYIGIWDKYAFLREYSHTM